MKKIFLIFALALITCLSLTMAVGCNDKDDSPSESTPASSSSSSSQPKYLVTWYIEENDVTTSEVTHGNAPAYPFSTPTKDSTDTTVYSFAGWSKTQGGAPVNLSQEAITEEDITYYAVFDSSARVYDITWVVNGEETTTTMAYNSAITQPTTTPTMVTTEDCSTTTYEFKGWADADGNIVTDFGTLIEDTTFTAVFGNPTSKWNGTIPTLASGATENTLFERDTNGNYLIQTATDLAELSALGKGKDVGDGKSFKMTANIDLSVGEWLPIGDDNGIPGDWPPNSGFTFKGNFDGDNHTITFNETNAGIYFALFNNICDRTIKNITFNGSITGEIYLACLAVRIWGNATIENITTNVNINATSTSNDTQAHTGGIIGLAGGDNNVFRNCTNTGNITANSHHIKVGGLIGYVHQGIAFTDAQKIKIENCSNSGTVKGSATASSDYGVAETYVGNLVGMIQIS